MVKRWRFVPWRASGLGAKRVNIEFCPFGTGFGDECPENKSERHVLCHRRQQATDWRWMLNTDGPRFSNRVLKWTTHLQEQVQCQGDIDPWIPHGSAGRRVNSRLRFWMLLYHYVGLIPLPEAPRDQIQPVQLGWRDGWRQPGWRSHGHTVQGRKWMGTVGNCISLWCWLLSPRPLQPPPPIYTHTRAYMYYFALENISEIFLNL